MTRPAILVAALSLSACAGDAQLTLTLSLSDAVYAASSTARIFISGAEAQFPSAAAQEVSPGLTVVNRDVDGDGRVDIVLDTDERFDLKKEQRFTLQPRGLTARIGVEIRAETYDAHATRVARIGGGARDLAGDHVSAVLAPGEQAEAPQLSPACVGVCPDVTARYGPGDVAQTIDLAGTPPTALAVAALDVAGRAELAIGAGEAATPAAGDRGEQPRAGRLEVWSGVGGQLARSLQLVGPHPGDRLGAQLAAADLDGDGLEDLLVGAPGDSGGRGAVWVLYGPVAARTSLSDAAVAVVRGAQPDAELGAALAAEDLDGDGRAEVLVGAPGESAVYLLRASDLARGQTTLTLPATGVSTVTGAAGARFGSALAARSGQLVVGAPEEPLGAAWLFAAAALLDGASHDTAGGTRWPGQGGGFGAAVALADRDGTGALTWLVGAGLDGPGRLLARPIAGLAAGDLDPNAGVATLRGGIPDGGVGASLSLGRGGLGDQLLFGAGRTGAAAGAAYALPVESLARASSLALDASGRPAGVHVSGGNAGDGFGSVTASGDLNQDGARDLVIGAAGAGTVSIVTGPIL